MNKEVESCNEKEHFKLITIQTNRTKEKKYEYDYG